MNEDKKPQNPQDQSQTVSSQNTGTGDLASQQTPKITPFPNTPPSTASVDQNAVPSANTDQTVPSSTMPISTPPSTDDSEKVLPKMEMPLASMTQGSTSSDDAMPKMQMDPTPPSPSSAATPAAEAKPPSAMSMEDMPSADSTDIDKSEDSSENSTMESSMDNPIKPSSSSMAMNLPANENSTPSETASPASNLSTSPLPPPQMPSQNMQEPQSPPPPVEESGGPNKVVLLVIPLIIFLLAALGYFAYTYLNPQLSANNPPAVPTQEPPTATPTPSYEDQTTQQIEEIQNVSASDEVTVLEQDVDATDFSNIDTDVSVLEKEL